MNPADTSQLDAVVNSLKVMGYAAVGVGPIDVRFGDYYYKTLRARALPVVNIGVPESTGAKPFIIKNVGGVKVGIVSFGMAQDNTAEDFRALKQRNDVYGEARQKSDVLIVLDQGNVTTDEWITSLAKKYGAPDLILGGTRNMILTEPKMVGETMIIPTSVQGTALGRVDFEVNGSAVKKTYSKIGIDDTYKEDPAILKIIKDYQLAHATAPPAEPPTPGTGATSTPTTPGTGSVPTTVPTANTHSTQIISAPSNTYTSYQTCTSCHKPQYDQWKTTRHAIALQTLEKGNKTFVECLPCHSEMYRRIQRTASGPDGLGGVECTTCHSNVVPHGINYKAKHDTAAIKSVCKNCHTPERSPKFSLTSYYDKIKHPMP